MANGIPGKRKGCAFRLGLPFILAMAVAAVGILYYRHKFDSYPCCHKALDNAFDQWMMESKTNAYPNLNGDSVKSLAAVMPWVGRVKERVSEQYAYIPGLKPDDQNQAPDLVLLYMKKKTRFYWHEPRAVAPEPMWMVIAPGFYSGDPQANEEHNRVYAEPGCLWDTAEFKRRFRRTLDYLRENKRPHWESIVKEQEKILDAIHD